MNNTRTNFIQLIIFLISIFSITITLVYGLGYNGYELTFLLPLTFALCSVGIFRYGIFDHLFSSIVYICYFIRMVVTPIAMAYGGFYTIIPSHHFQYSIPLAIILICIENIVVFVYLKKQLLNTNMSHNLIEHVFTKDNLISPSILYSLLILLIAGACIAIVGLDPSISKHVIVSLIEEKNEYFALSDTNTGIGTLSMFVQILSFLIKIVQITLPPLLLYYICKMRGKLIRYALILSLFFVLCIYGTEDRIFSLIAGASFFLTVTATLNTKEVKSLGTVFGVLFLLIAFGGLYLKSNHGTDDSAAQTASMSLCAYFSGLPTVAVGLDYVLENGYIHLFDFFTDAIAKIPFAQYAINMFYKVNWVNTNSAFNEYITRLVGYNIGQIFPTSCLGMWYFSILLFPIYPCMLVRLARYYNEKISTSSNIFEHSCYCWITLCVSMSPVVFSGLLLVPRLAIFYIVIVIIRIFNKKRVYVN